MPSLPLGYLKRLFAGAVFGLYTGHLLYTLNPQIEIGPVRLLAAVAVYTVIAALVFGNLLWGLRVARIAVFGRPDEEATRRHGLGLVVVAALLSAFFYWMHLQAYKVFLPVEAVRVLRRGTHLISLTAFLFLVLWVIERNATPRVRRVVLVIGLVLIVASGALLHVRRERYRQVKNSVVVANIGTVAGERPVIVVSVQSLPHDWILTLAGEGSLPWMTRASRESYFARIEPYPSRSQRSLWASFATGQLPHRHGVTGRYAYETLLNEKGEPYLILPGGIGFRAWGLVPPVQKLSARLPAGSSLPLWELFDRLGFSSVVVQWPWLPSPGKPAAVIERDVDQGVLSDRSVPSRFEGLSARASTATRLAFLSDVAAAREFSSAVGSSPRALAVLSVNALARITGVTGIDGNDLPPRGTPRGTAVRSYLEWVDELIASIEAAAPEAIIVVASPSGNRAPEPPLNPMEIVLSMMNRDPGASDGFVIIRGRGAVNRHEPPIARCTDLVPTILFAAGLPVARDMDGRVLIEAFDEEFLEDKSIALIQTYQAGQLVVRRDRAP